MGDAMARRNSNVKDQPAGEAAGSTADAIEQGVITFAEQLGRVVGTVQGKAEGWLDRDALSAQVAQVRDSAVELLEHLSGKSTAAATAGGKNAGAPREKSSSIETPPASTSTDTPTRAAA